MRQKEDPRAEVAMSDHSKEEPAKCSCCRCHGRRSAYSEWNHKCD